jgi:hypothetical protein
VKDYATCARAVYAAIQSFRLRLHSGFRQGGELCDAAVMAGSAAYLSVPGEPLALRVFSNVSSV